MNHANSANAVPAQSSALGLRTSDFGPRTSDFGPQTSVLPRSEPFQNRGAECEAAAEGDEADVGARALVRQDFTQGERQGIAGGVAEATDVIEHALGGDADFLAYRLDDALIGLMGNRDGEIRKLQPGRCAGAFEHDDHLAHGRAEDLLAFHVDMLAAVHERNAEHPGLLAPRGTDRPEQVDGRFPAEAIEQAVGLDNALALYGALLQSRH